MAVRYLYLTVLVIGYAAIEIKGKFTPPRVIPSLTEIIIQSGDSYTLKCEGTKPVIWTYPDFSSWSLITVNTSTNAASDYPFESYLNIYNASYLNTGFYNCHGDTTDLENENRTTSPYLYVKDDEHLSILPEFNDAITVTQYSKAVLPCRPTSPDVHVELIRSTGEEIEDFAFDPKIGFSFIASDLSLQDDYHCKFTMGPKTFECGIFLLVVLLTDSIPKPYIVDLNKGHTIVGNPIRLRCTEVFAVHFIMEWLTPNKGVVQPAIKVDPNTRDGFISELIINKTTLADEGVYTCVVRDHQNNNSATKYLRVFGTHENYINFTEENGIYDISTKAGTESVQWKIDVHAHPIPKLTWYDNRNNEIMHSKKYEITSDSTSAFLRIKDVTIADRGTYRLEASHVYEAKNLSLFLNVTDKPSIVVFTNDFNMLHKLSIVRCQAAAYPEPNIFWSYKPCKEDDESCDYKPLVPFKLEKKGLTYISHVNLTAEKSGTIKCFANNSLGSDNATKPFTVTDVDGGFSIWGLDMLNNNATVATGETITISCGAAIDNFSNQTNWYKKDEAEPIQNDDRYTIEKGFTDLSYRTYLTINYVNEEDTGGYACGVKLLGSDVFKFTNITLKVADPKRPKIITKTLYNETRKAELPLPILFKCEANGLPKPIITWYKNDIKLTSQEPRIELQDDNTKLYFTHTLPQDEAVYKCTASNRMGSDVQQMALSFTNPPGLEPKYIAIIIGLIVTVVLIGVILLFRLFKDRKLRKELKLAGLANFEKGALENINPDLGLDDQAELLPYDKKWEFPRDKLRLGKQLGSGAFGVVMKAEAYNILDEELMTTVAVKMVKRNADYTYIKALASELKIMVHLGKHLNVVNLLGACTKNVVKRELLVIVEYCRFGNLHNYLMRHRNDFINQIDPKKAGTIDYTIGAELLERSFSVSSGKSDGAPVQPMADYRGNCNYTGNSTNTETTTICMTPTGATGEDGGLSSNNSAQPEWRSNYRGDYKGTVKPICTKDLLTWAFQVARGMEYLASRKVLHGDLAARNVLLAENNIVKICDFGLAKSMYKNDNYKKKGDGPLPVKWMAVESIRDRVFSTQSDVWSYGIVMWEFFSLARTPYPGMEADERLYNMLVEGYRMDSPQYATKDIYQMMLDCWHDKPLKRPSFTKLAERIGYMLEDSVRKHYIDLNDPYLVMNTRRIEEGYSDYLAMLSPPDFENLSSPHDYVNDETFPDVCPKTAESAGYLCMKPTQIFSPRDNGESVFNFDVNKKHKNSDGEIATGTELLPMLHTQIDSDSELSPNVVATPTSFSNPSYQMPPILTAKSDENILKSADNYVNMPQNKSAIKNDKIKDSDGSKENDCNKNDRVYINSCSRDWEPIKS